MKKKQLEMTLERLEGFSEPSFIREQYATPASVAAEILFLAALRNDLGTVCDLGCGTGVLAIGAALMGARAVGVEIDKDALATARKNAENLGVDVDFIRADVRKLELEGIDTVIMNPPLELRRPAREIALSSPLLRGSLGIFILCTTGEAMISLKNIYFPMWCRRSIASHFL